MHFTILYKYATFACSFICKGYNIDHPSGLVSGKVTNDVTMYARAARQRVMPDGADWLRLVTDTCRVGQSGGRPWPPRYIWQALVS